MRKLFWVVLIIIFVHTGTVWGQSQTIVTGTITGPTGVAATSGYVQFVIQPASSAVAYRVSGTSVLAPQASNCGINASGQLQNLTLTGNCLVWGNTAITPGNTAYQVVVAPNGTISNRINSVLISGTSYDLSNIVFQPSIKLVPQQAQITVSPVQSNLIPGAAHVFNVGSAAFPYASGFFDNLTVNNGLSISSLNNIQLCDKFSGNAGAKISSCIAALGSNGGVADARSILGSQLITSQIAITQSNVKLLLGCATYTLSGVTPSQGPPFIGGVIQLGTTASGVSNVSIEGTPGCTTFQLAAGETANVFTIYSSSGQCSSGNRIESVIADGNKANNTAGTDDTFQGGVHIITNASATCDSRDYILNSEFRNFNHYGIVLFGPFSNGNVVSGNKIHDNGKTGDANSTGDGVYFVSGASRNQASLNESYSNLRTGFRSSSNGIAMTGNQWLGNNSHDNTQECYKADEASNLGSLAGIGQSGAVWSANYAKGCTYSYRLGTANNVGVITGFTITSNIGTAASNDAMVATSNAAPNNVSNISFTGNMFGSATGGFGLDLGANVTAFNGGGNTFPGNSSGPISDGGTNTVVCYNTGGDAINHCTNSQTNGGTDTAGNFQVNAGSYQANAGGRTFGLAASGGNWNITSGDGAGVITAAVTGGVSSTIFTSTVSTGTAPLAITSTTPVTNLNATPLTYNHSGTQTVATHHVLDVATFTTGSVTVTLTGSSVYTAQSTYVCNGTDISNALTVVVSQSSGSSVTFSASGGASDTIVYHCFGR